MGMIHHLVGVALSVVLLSIAYGGTEAFRSSDQASQELDQKLHAPMNKTNLLVRGLFSQTSPHDGSGGDPTYYAIHGARTTASGGIYGFVGTMDMYGFSLRHGQGSATGVWLVDPGDGSRSSVQEIMVGWHVLPAVCGDSRTYFYTRWTDRVSGAWLVHCGMNEEPKLIGRFPRSLFTGGGLADKATAISFGGAVTAPVADPAPMGNGYLPRSGAAASISDIQLVDKSGRAWRVIKDLSKVESRPEAFAVSPIVDGQFFYGGPRQPTAAP